MKKIRSMMKPTREAILKEAERLLSSGAIDVERADNDYRLPELVLCVALHNAAFDWEPPYATKEDKRLMKNLYRF
jgi:hypothetical protein